MRKWAGSSTKTDFTATIASPPTAGEISLTLTATETTSLKAGRHVYNVVITKGHSSPEDDFDGCVFKEEQQNDAASQQKCSENAGFTDRYHSSLA